MGERERKERGRVREEGRDEGWETEGGRKILRFHQSVFCDIHLFVSAHKLSTVFKSLLLFNIFLLYPFKVNFLK